MCCRRPSLEPAQPTVEVKHGPPFAVDTMESTHDQHICQLKEITADNLPQHQRHVAEFSVSSTGNPALEDRFTQIIMPAAYTKLLSHERNH